MLDWALEALVDYVYRVLSYRCWYLALPQGPRGGCVVSEASFSSGGSMTCCIHARLLQASRRASGLCWVSEGKLSTFQFCAVLVASLILICFRLWRSALP
jgi:hypothetical protein